MKTKHPDHGKRISSKISATRGQRTTATTGNRKLSVRELRQRIGVSRKVFSRLVGFSERAIADWEADKALSDAANQRLQEIARLHKALAGIMRPEHIGTWLLEPNPGFNELKPIEVVERGEIDRLWRMIYQLESGMTD